MALRDPSGLPLRCTAITGSGIGTPDEVLRSEVLSELYGTPVDVVRVRDRVIVVGGPDEAHHAHAGHEHPEATTEGAA